MNLKKKLKVSNYGLIEKSLRNFHWKSDETHNIIGQNFQSEPGNPPPQ
jgi:hypothetical protein